MNIARKQVDERRYGLENDDAHHQIQMILLEVDEKTKTSTRYLRKIQMRYFRK